MEEELKKKFLEEENQKILEFILANQAQRHVKEPNEPALQEILEDFTKKYALMVVTNSVKEITKEIIKNER